jgi:hypothetical protein
MRRLLLLALLLPLAVEADTFRRFRKNGLTQVSATPAAILECETVAAQGLLTGAYFCLNGDGTQDSVQTLTAVNSPNVSTITLADADSSWDLPALSFDAEDHYKTASVAPPTGDFSVCAHVVIATTSGHQFVSKDDQAGNRSWFMQQNNNAVYVAHFSNAGTKDNNAAVALTAGEDFVICSTYHEIGAANSELRTYANGSLIGSRSDLGDETASGSGDGWYVATRPGEFATPFDGYVVSAFMTEHLMTLAEVQTLTTALRER